MITLLIRFGLEMTSRAFQATRFFGLLGLMGLLAACGGGGGGGGGTGGGGGGGSSPPAVTLSSITVGPSTAQVAAGLTLQFTATGTYSDGTQKDISSTVTWTSSDTSKATISASGLVTGVAAGPSTITATTSGVSGTDPLTVEAPNLVSLVVSPSTPSVVAGLTLQFKATGTYSDSTQKDLSSTVTWASSDNTKATISASGLATGVGVGTTTVTATMSGVSGTDLLTVAPPNLLSVVISPNAPTITIHKNLQFSAIGSYTDGSTKDLTANVVWASSNTTIASISSSTGLATSTALLGNTNISAVMTGGPAITSVQMTVTTTKYAYATNFDDDTVSQYQLNNDGTLSPLSLPTVPAGHQPFSISVEPTGEYVYVSNWGSSNLSQYRIESNGSLSAIGTAVATGLFPNAVTINHADSFAYVANLGDSTISQFKIGLDGQLTALSTPRVASGANPASLAVDPTDHFAYAANFGINNSTPPPGPGTISQYSIGSDGSLTPMSAPTVVSGSGPNALTIDFASKYLYVANQGDNNVGQYTIGAGGALTAMATPTIGSGTRPVGITIDPTGSYVYVANYTDGTISQYTVGTSGALTAMSTATVPAGSGVSGLTIDPTGQYLYAANRGATIISQFVIGTGGALTPASSATVAAGLHPTAIATGY